MNFPENTNNKIDEFLDNFFDFVSSESEFTYYKEKTQHKPGEGVIELKSGILLPESEESVFVLHKEFEPFLLGILIKFMKQMKEEAGNSLFGFATRPLYEYITVWIFLFYHPEVDFRERERLKALLFAGHYKFINESHTDFNKYMKQASSSLRQSDINSLKDGNLGAHSYFKRLWRESKSICSEYGESPTEILESSIDLASAVSHQHMAVHSNPLRLNELLGEFDKKARHKILLILYARQVLEYFNLQDIDKSEPLIKEYDSLIDHIESQSL